jgi:pyruvate kinase
MLRTKIVCTIGPASRDPAILAALIRAGMDVARLNMSHGDLEFHGENIRRIRRLAEELGKPVAILADLQGPKLRVGVMPSEGVSLHPGEALVLTTEPILGGPGRVPVQYEHLPEAVKVGDRILIDDGLIELAVIAVEGREIRTQVVIEGTLMSNKGLNLPHASLAIPAITEKDREDLRFALESQVDAVALSFVRSAAEVLELKSQIRDLLPAHKAGLPATLGRTMPRSPAPLVEVIAKIEKPEAVDNIDAIIEAADGIMVARGDLGIEMSTEAVPMVQKAIIRKCNQAGKPVITATQMLDSMIRNPRPTRAEASDVANAILDGSDAIMLSGETAAGKYPVLAVETMARIACETEEGACDFGDAESHLRVSVPHRFPVSFSEAVAHASVAVAADLNAKAILAPTVSGQTARTIARFRPGCLIVAVTPNPIIQRQLVLVWGVYPILAPRAKDTDQVLREAVEAAQRHGYVREGDVIVITGGSMGYDAGTTNLMKVHLVERVLARGVGIGDRRVIGRVRRLTLPLDPLLNVASDEIVVTPHADPTSIPLLRRAAGLVTADAAGDSDSRLLALEIGIPAVVGVREDLEVLRDGMEVVLDAEWGIVYDRPPAPEHAERRPK